jgi:hypothetical protein
MLQYPSLQTRLVVPAHPGGVGLVHPLFERLNVGLGRNQGHAEVHPLPETPWAHLELFVAAWLAFEVYWAAGGAVRLPNSRPAYDRWVERAAGDLGHFLAT